MERVLIIGSGGAGKSTLAAHIARSLHLPLIHLDALYWHPGWRPTPKAEWEEVIAHHIAGPRWVMDGNYSGTLDLRLARCDTVVFLDLPRAVCLWRVVGRWLRFRGRSRPDMAPDCPEQLTWEFIHWIWTYPARRPDLRRKLSSLRPDQRVITLSSRRMVQGFLNELRAQTGA
jgi:adenylate kinase family enzyme